MMNGFLDRKRMINEYILNAQLLFFIVSAIIILKYLHFEYLNFSPFKYFIILAFSLLFVVILGVCLKYKDNPAQNVKKLHLFIIFLDLIIINIMVASTNIYEVRFLYLIPIIIAAIDYGNKAAIFLSICIGLSNILVINYCCDIFYPFNYSVETDLIFTGILVLLSWLIGIEIKVEKDIRNSLIDTQVNLYRNKKILEILVNEISLALVVINKEEKIIHMNEKALKIFDINMSVSEYIGKSYQKYYREIWKNISYKKSAVHNVLSCEKKFVKEKRVLNKKLIDLVCQPVYDECEGVKFVILALSDVTKEEQLREKFTQFEKMSTVSQMAASIAHEIKNPLTTIKGFLDLSLKSKINLNQDQLVLLNSEVDRCRSIASDFLSVARKSNEKKDMVNIVNLIRDHSLLIEKDALFNGITLELELNEVQDILVYENQIKQLLLNLSRNAIEAMGEGGVLTIRTYEDSNYIYLEIEDEGQGIPQDLLEKIGTPFFTTKEKGTGLGMVICKQIVDSNRATMKIDSKEGVGTKITVNFLKDIN